MPTDTAYRAAFDRPAPSFAEAFATALRQVRDVVDPLAVGDRRLRHEHGKEVGVLEPGPAEPVGRQPHEPLGLERLEHLDLAAEDIPAAEQHALELGATLAEPQPGDSWRVLLDPAGHAFCLTDAASWG